MADTDKKKHSTAMVVGVVILLVVLLLWLGGSGSSSGGGTDPGTGGGTTPSGKLHGLTWKKAAHEVTSLPDQTLRLYNRYAPDGWHLGGAKIPSALPAPPKKSGFVGAFGRTPEMQHCLNYDSPADKTYDFNRCTWA